jgi:hypothetical protein
MFGLTSMEAPARHVVEPVRASYTPRKPNPALMPSMRSEPVMALSRVLNS